MTMSASSHPEFAAASTPDTVPPPRLLDVMRARMRRLGLSLRTEEAYVGWVRRFIRAHDLRHPRTMGAREVEAFLTLLATRDQVSASTQNQALAVLLFLYREVLEQQLPWMDDIRRAKRPERLPTVLSRDEVQMLLAQMSGVTWLLAGLLYGAGLRLMECLRLRVQDIDFVRREITAFVCHPPSRSGLGYPHCAGVAGPQGRVHHDDLHPRAQPRRGRRTQPAGPGSRLMVWREARRRGCGQALRRTRRAVRPAAQGRV